LEKRGKTWCTREKKGVRLRDGKKGNGGLWGLRKRGETQKGIHYFQNRSVKTEEKKECSLDVVHEK